MQFKIVELEVIFSSVFKMFVLFQLIFFDLGNAGSMSKILFGISIISEHQINYKPQGTRAAFQNKRVNTPVFDF